jgi:hypothetical protein
MNWMMFLVFGLLAACIAALAHAYRALWQRTAALAQAQSDALQAAATHHKEMIAVVNAAKSTVADYEARLSKLETRNGSVFLKELLTVVTDVSRPLFERVEVLETMPCAVAHLARFKAAAALQRQIDAEPTAADAPPKPSGGVVFAQDGIRILRGTDIATLPTPILVRLLAEAERAEAYKDAARFKAELDRRAAE